MTITIYKSDTKELIFILNTEDDKYMIKAGYDVMIDKDEEH